MDELLFELKPQIETLAEPLFGASEMFVRKRGGFLPHGAVLEAGGEVRLVMAAPDDLDATVSPAEILPRLHDALRAEAHDHDLAAVAVCEDVTITPAGQKPTKAVKVLVEHRRGLTVALYLPWKRKLLGGHIFGACSPIAGGTTPCVAAASCSTGLHPNPSTPNRRPRSCSGSPGSTFRAVPCAATAGCRSRRSSRRPHRRIPHEAP